MGHAFLVDGPGFFQIPLEQILDAFKNSLHPETFQLQTLHTPERRASRAGDPGKNATAEDVYFPLASGMEWVIDLKVVSAKGEITNGVLHRKIGEAVQFRDKNYFRSHTWLVDGRPFAMDYTKLVRRGDNGFYSIDERDPERVEEQGGNCLWK